MARAGSDYLDLDPGGVYEYTGRAVVRVAANLAPGNRSACGLASFNFSACPARSASPDGSFSVPVRIRPELVWG